MNKTSKWKKWWLFFKHKQYCKENNLKSVSQHVFYIRVKNRWEKKAIETPNLWHWRPQLFYSFNSLSSS